MVMQKLCVLLWLISRTILSAGDCSYYFLSASKGRKIYVHQSTTLSLHKKINKKIQCYGITRYHFSILSSSPSPPYGVFLPMLAVDLFTHTTHVIQDLRNTKPFQCCFNIVFNVELWSIGINTVSDWRVVVENVIHKLMKFFQPRD